jgi:transcription antitermination factor NusG
MLIETSAGSISQLSIPDRSWFAVQTWPRYEKKVADELRTKSIEVFLPLQSSVRQWSDRRTTVQVPLFPSYVFVRIPEQLHTRVSVLRTNGVTGFVGSTRAGTPISEGEIESIHIILRRSIPYESCPFVGIGQRVRIRGGSLDGVEGILVGKNQDLSLVVSIKIIQRSVAVRVAGYRVEPIHDLVPQTS